MAARWQWRENIHLALTIEMHSWRLLADADGPRSCSRVTVGCQAQHIWLRINKHTPFNLKFCLD